jgi:glycosyltransferase involved in cell wall biosynthesis
MSSANVSGTILLFIDSLGSGGAQRQLITLANALADKNYKVYLVTYYPFWHFRDFVAHEKVELIYLPRGSRLDVLFVFRLTRLLYKIKPDVILSYLFTPNVLVRLARLMYWRKCKVITSERNIDLQISASRLFIEKLMSRFSDIIVTNAAATRDMLVQSRVCSVDKIKVIPNGVNVGRFTPLSSGQKSESRKKFGIGEKSFVILLPGRIQKQKNHISLLKALALIPDIASRCEVLFVGDIIDLEYKDSLDEYIKDNLQGIQIHFAGQCDEMNDVYEIADLVVLPSLFEGLPNVIIEAMYKSKLIALSDVSDNAAIIRDGVSGFIHGVNDDQKLAEIICKAINMPATEAERIGRAANDDFIKRYTVDAMLDAYLDIFGVTIEER